MDYTMTPDEYSFLKKWAKMHPKQQLASPTPANKVMQGLIDAGFLRQITRPDASNPEIGFVIGYEVTPLGEDAVKQYQATGHSS